MANGYDVAGENDDALFTLRIHRGEGMCLLAMNWKKGKPPKPFVGFAIEYKEPGGDRYFVLRNRLSFASDRDEDDANALSSLRAPIQKFRWVHFPRNAEMDGEFTYRVTPVFMNEQEELSYGEAQIASLELRRETYPKKLNVTFTRGMVASQAFVDNYSSGGPIADLLPKRADDGLEFAPTHPKQKEALAWMGFEARSAILEVLDEAIADDKAEVRVVAYDLNEPEIVKRLKKLKKRLKIIIDNSGSHAAGHSAETAAAEVLARSAGAANVKRQKMGKLQHNKTIAVRGPKVKAAICGSTNFTWRGLFVQSNNAVVVRGDAGVRRFMDAFDDYWDHGTVAAFGATESAEWADLGVTGVDAKIAFSPHAKANALLESVAKDIARTKSSLFYSLAFLYQTPGVIRDAIEKVTNSDSFVYGISDRDVGGLDIQLPDGNVRPVYPDALKKNAPSPFKEEPTGGGGNRMHHKFLVVDFDKPTARVYFGSYNFSGAADTQNGENLVLIKDRRVAVAYMVEAVRIFDHYHFRVTQNNAANAKTELVLSKPPREAGETAWWEAHYSDERKKRDRLLFA